jgi:hypothetical protein
MHEFASVCVIKFSYHVWRTTENLVAFGHILITSYEAVNTEMNKGPITNTI